MAKKSSERGDIELGDLVKDNVTGFQGIAIGEHDWLHGCKRWSVQPQELKDGKPVEAGNFDDPQLSIVKKQVVPGKNKKEEQPGGPKPEVSRGHKIPARR